uniref:Small glutamine-rich tetratricopeptide repeat-containing protein 2 n=1 Tax=Rhizophora mucronata TaxID=61149 RepID=A0A2P2LG12_RHIMU
MANLKTDSPVSHRIVRAFLDFLDSVEPAPGVDVEGLDVAKECLREAFKLDLDSADDTVQPGLLVNIFRLLEANENQRIKTDSTGGATSADAPMFSSTQNVADANHSEASKTQGEDWTREPNESGGLIIFLLLVLH